MDDQLASQFVATTLRAQGLSCVEVSARLRERFDLNALRAMRLAHGLTQAEAAAAWTAQWPDDPKTAENLRYWESYDTQNGWPPNPLMVARLAELYGCAVTDLGFEVDQRFERLPGTRPGQVSDSHIDARNEFATVPGEDDR